MDDILLIRIIEVILPSLVAILTVFLTNYFNTISSKHKILQHRIDVVYKPFYLSYFKYETNLNLWEDFDVIENISKINNICLKNIDCIETNTQEIVINLSSELSLWSPGADISVIEDMFKSLTNNMINEYSTICYKLKYPKPVSPK